MTDARFPERWLNDLRILKLTDAAFRLHVTGLAMSVSNRTDGHLTDDALMLIHRVNSDRVDELERGGLWRRDGDGWLITDFAATQTAANELAALENARRRDREKKARQRMTAKVVPGTVPGSGEGDVSPRTAQDRQGEDRLGEDDLRDALEDLCSVCHEPLSADSVAAGWTEHGTCGGAWPAVTQLPA